ncbi:16S rRNA (guanine(527)-N(7))-methyltransferase RsmG [Gellertiella hungarica]|uniref:Ribosomal RNA small subunit methyltransferase G n=1 Tax=Gellertiella hungarica TaxID=1572859 RepID=A0A7W6NN04_9HYPH|nr:16S rRNA (guanine(527)-N(7))-methyltransferase RsmG [Gellertiella hungarica]MBB4066847.1 16S rRNA (guanine527-N7)-methyltransferase [Gellertiella hungarica]
MQLNGQRVSRETQERLQLFEQLFRKWARTINLVAPSTKEQFWERHIADSAQIFQLAPRPLTWADLGSGGGFPGIITAIFLAELGDGWVHLVESNQKKAAFLRTALLETGARGTIHPKRIEDVWAEFPRVDAISARAIAELDLLCSFSAPWMAANPDTVAYFHKGRDYRAEIAKARGRWEFDLVEHKSSVEADSVILELHSVRSKS